MQELEPGAEVAFAWDVSADGRFIVGGFGSSTVFGGTQEAFRWTAESQYEFLGFAQDGGPPSAAFAISADGSAVAGSAQTQDGVRAFRWTAPDGIVPLGDLPGGENLSLGHEISADGRVVVGESSSGPFREAFRWAAETGMVGLGDLPGGDFLSIATATSGDGSIVVGNSSTTGPGSAFIWDPIRGMRNLTTVLEDDFGLDLTGWRLDGVSDISADGLTIVGTGTNPAGDPEAWIVTIPEPSAWLLGTAASFLLILALCVRVQTHKVCAK
jgi:probable HAF family extracellular repeat protein